MSEQKKYKPFEHPRWHEIPAYEIIGYTEVTKEQKERAARFAKEIDEKIKAEKEEKMKNQ